MSRFIYDDDDVKGLKIIQSNPRMSLTAGN